MLDLGECRRMHARISERQCGINRQRGMFSCEKCDGLVNGKLVSEEAAMPTNKKRATCMKCERPNQVIFSHGQCYPCSYGSGMTMTKEQVLAEVAAGTYGQRGPKTSTKRVKPLDIKADNEPVEVAQVPSEPRTLLSRVATPTPIPPGEGLFLDFSGHPGLLADLKAISDDVPGDILELCSLLVQGNLQRVA